MKNKTLIPAFVLTALSMTFSAQAHDPKEHMKNAESPDCAAMKDMDHKRMNKNDPVMQAMMKKCMKHMDHGNDMKGMNHNSSVDDSKKQSDKQHSGHQH